MADRRNQCDFIQHDLLYFQCKEIAQDPQQTSCDCVQLYCNTCFQQQRQKSSMCSMCYKELTAFPDHLSAQRIEALNQNTNTGAESQWDQQKQGQVQETLRKKQKLEEKRQYTMHLYRFQELECLNGDRDNLIMLYLPCLIICAMIVCIVSSAFALGHV